MNARLKVMLAVAAFQSQIDDNEEYGVSDLDAEKGMLAALLELGIVTAGEAANVRKAWKKDESMWERRRGEQEAARYNALSPEEKLIEYRKGGAMTSLLDKVSSGVIDQLFQGTPIMGFMRTKRKVSCD